MFGLYMNCMHCRAEQSELVAVAETAEALVALQEREAVEPYTENGWHKSFRKGGPLENFNPLGHPAQTIAEADGRGPRGADRIRPGRWRFPEPAGPASHAGARDPGPGGSSERDALRLSRLAGPAPTPPPADEQGDGRDRG